MKETASNRPLALAVIIAIVFLALQFVRPAIQADSSRGELQAPANVKAVLTRSCYDCHSDTPKLAWFDQIVPAYWLVHSDISEARKHLNFSEIGLLPPAQQRALLFEGLNQARLGAMPLPSYRALHPGTSLTPNDLITLQGYLTSISPTAINIVSPAAQNGPTAEHTDVLPSPNGVAFDPDYKNWHEISSTLRFDNGSMRVILGNPTAIAAIEHGEINPWPEGSRLAKVAFAQTRASDGRVVTGAFIQVELMIRNSRAYSKTDGWGWGRWRGSGLKPYGKDASVSNECTGCHEPMKHNDYVFTAPISLGMGSAR